MNKTALLLALCYTLPSYAMIGDELAAPPSHKWATPFDLNPHNARDYFASGGKLESWMIDRTITWGALEVLQVIIDEGKARLDKHMDYHGQDPKNILYFPPLHQAVQASKPAIIHYLIAEKKVDPNLQEPTCGDTPLHVALLFSDDEAHQALEALLQHTVDLTLKNKKQQTPHDLARERNDTKALRLLAAYKSKK